MASSEVWVAQAAGTYPAREGLHALWDVSPDVCREYPREHARPDVCREYPRQRARTGSS